MHYAFWDMVPGDALFAEIDQLHEGRQKRFFLMVAEECLLYNRKYDASLTFGEFKRWQYPDYSSCRTQESNDPEEEPE